jgi:hypothetical protein
MIEWIFVFFVTLLQSGIIGFLLWQRKFDAVERKCLVDELVRVASQPPVMVPVNPNIPPAGQIPLGDEGDYLDYLESQDSTVDEVEGRDG